MTESDLSLRYRNLMRSALLGRIYPEDDVRFLYLALCRALQSRPDPVVLADPAGRLAELHQFVLERKKVGAPWWKIAVANADSSTSTLDLREWCDVGNCEDGDDRLEVAEELLTTLQERGIDGDVLDIGATRPGFAIFCRAYQLSSGQAGNRVVMQIDSDDFSFDSVVKRMRSTASGFGISEGICLEKLRWDLPLDGARQYAMIRIGAAVLVDWSRLKDYLMPALKEGGYMIFEGIYNSERAARLQSAAQVFAGLQHFCLDIGGWRKL